MYEIIEHWKQYKSEKLTRLELELKQMLKENSINRCGLTHQRVM